MSLKSSLFVLLRNAARNSGYDLVKIQKSISLTSKSEGHEVYLKSAEEAGLDVNDYQEEKLGYLKPLPLLEESFFPVLEKFNKPTVIELGPGTGRWSRHIINFLKSRNGGKLILTDHSKWMVIFLESYFKESADSNLKISYELCNGFVLPDNIEDSSADVIFSANTLVALGIYNIYTYSHDFFRTLKKGGYCIFDYIDINSEGGWNFLKQKITEGLNYYSYHTFDAVNKVFLDAGFEFKKKTEFGKSTYLTYIKP